MLENGRFRITRGRVGRDLSDADAGTPLGTAREVVTPAGRFLRLLSRSLAGTLVEVREEPDAALVFTLTRGWWLGRGVEVRDGRGERVGVIRGTKVSAADGRPFAVIADDGRLLTPDRAVELAAVGRTGGAAVVIASDDLDERPLAKMLVLAAVLAADMM